MENVIARIVEIEKQCAETIDKAEKDSKEKIAAHSRMLEEKKEKKFSAITAAASENLARTIEESKKRIESETEAAKKDNKRILQDSALHETIKQKVLSMLLGT
jgi:hypothetical protein